MATSASMDDSTDHSSQDKVILTCRGFAIRKCAFSPTILSTLKRELTVKPKSHPDFPEPVPFPIYQETQHWMRLPRHFALQRFGRPSKVALRENRIDDESRMVFAMDLFEPQKAPFGCVMQQFHEGMGEATTGMLSLPTGSGKTVVSLKVASTLARRTCILVHKDLLLHQWVEAIRKFMPGATIGIVQGKNKSFDERCDFYIVMLQTLLNIPSVPNIFGLTIWDEIHHAPSTTFSTVFYKVSAKFMLGLSATLQRKDGLSFVLEHHLGPVLYTQKPDRSDQLRTDIWACGYANKAGSGSAKQWADMITRLGGDIKRNAYLLRIITHILREDATGERKMLILTNRLEHVHHIYTELDAWCTVNSPERTRTMILGGMKNRKAALAKDIIVATYSMAGEGVDMPHLNTVVFASPKKDVIQALGRIFRKVHAVSPLVVDLCDSMLPGQSRARMSTYRSELKANIKVMHCEESDFPIS